MEGKTMKNIDMTVNGDILTIKIDLTKTFGSSSSGKTTIVASTGGSVKVKDVNVGINVYKSKGK